MQNRTRLLLTFAKDSYIRTQVPFEAVDVWVPLCDRDQEGSEVVLFHAGYFTNVREPYRSATIRPRSMLLYFSACIHVLCLFARFVWRLCFCAVYAPLLSSVGWVHCLFVFRDKTGIGTYGGLAASEADCVSVRWVFLYVFIRIATCACMHGGR